MPKRYVLYHGACSDILNKLPENSIDSIVCDPPYGIKMMGKSWDYNLPTINDWESCLRVLKPGGHLLAFASTRTQHRMAMRIEDAGFEIRDMLMWMYSQGMPKSKCLLKPSVEPITMARKSLNGTVEKNVETWGLGELNIDSCRIPLSLNVDSSQLRTMTRGVRQEDGRGMNSTEAKPGQVVDPAGRWPANVIHDGSEELLSMFPNTTSGTGAVKRKSSKDVDGNTGTVYGEENRPDGTPMICYGDSGSAARFFYCAKAKGKDKHEGLDGEKNNHIAVKPTELMRWLCKLITPLNGIVLDPFLGSGSTGKACMLEGFRFVGIDLEAEYVELARKRIEFTLTGVEK